MPSRNDEERRQTVDLLISERDRLQWRAQGLPADTESFIGASRALLGNLVPLFLDPSGVAVGWLRANAGETRLETTRPDDPRFSTSVELAVRFGKPLLVEEIVRLPALLLPLLRGRPLRVGERSLPAQSGFRLFLATRQERLALPSEAEATLVEISLGSGSKSLAERLVDKAILQETPEVEARRREVLEREERLSGEIEAARLELLVQLGAARGQDILQVESQRDGSGGLLSTLELTQSKAREIARALEESRRELADVDERGKEHESLAEFAARLHEIVGSFAALSSLYVFTAEAVTELFLEAERLRSTISMTASRDEREKLLEKSLVALILQHCTRAVYRKHRLPLALHLAMSLSSVPQEQRVLLLRGESAYVGSSAPESEVPSFVPAEQRSAVRALIVAMPEMAQKLKHSWVGSVASIYAEEDSSHFEKILAIQALHPEHLHTALSKWAAQMLGVKNLTPPSWTLKRIAEENEKRAVLLLLSPGADPEPELRSLVANGMVTATGFTEVSLGQGHAAQAEAALQTACKQGSWILLSNLQLALNWLPRLEAILRSPGCTSQRNPNTRIWLTTEECSGFYSGLSGLCLKLAYEPPEGVKRNVKRSLHQLQQRQPPIIDPCKSLLVSWLHAILQERRKFVPQGWIKAYAWSEADLEAACELVVGRNINHGNVKSNEDWEADRGILDVAVYGGLLQDEYDMRMLRAILRQVWSKDTYTGRRKLGGAVSVPKAVSNNPIVMVERLDDADSIQMYFGLPANAHRAWEKSAAELTLRYLNEILRKTAKVRNENGDRNASSVLSKTIKDLKLIIDQQRVDDSRSDRKEARESRDDPLKRFFADEVNTTRRLLRLVRYDLDRLRSTDELKTPGKWISEWQSGPREILPFVHRLISRYQSLVSLSGLPNKVELCWFARPEAFLSALKQYTARESGRPFENLQLRTRWTEDSADREGGWKTAVYVEGLLLTGARIENGVLEEVTANASSVVTAPACLVAFVDDAGQSDTGEEQADAEWVDSDIELTSDLCALQVPVYADSFRSHLICSLPVPYLKEQRDSWHQRGISFHLRSN